MFASRDDNNSNVPFTAPFCIQNRIDMRNMQPGIARASIHEQSNIHVMVLLIGSIVIEPKQISQLPSGTAFVRVRIRLVFRPLVHLVHQLFPLDGFRQLLTQRPSDGHHVGEMPSARNVGHHLNQRRLQIDLVQGFDELQFRRRHQRRVKRTAHRQVLDPTNAKHLVIVRDELQSLDEIISIAHTPHTERHSLPCDRQELCIRRTYDWLSERRERRSS